MAFIVSANRTKDIRFNKFGQLPPELRIYIWNLAIAEESRGRIVLLDMFQPGRVCPTQDLASPFLSVSRESRDCAVRYYDCKVMATRRETDTMAGVIHLRPEEHCFTIDQMGGELKPATACNGCYRCPGKITNLYEASLTPADRFRITTGLLTKQCQRGAYIRESYKFLPSLRKVYWMKWKREPSPMHPSIFFSTLAHLGPAKAICAFESLGAYWIYHEW
jgi:hypothetical protein